MMTMETIETVQCSVTFIRTLWLSASHLALKSVKVDDSGCDCYLNKLTKSKVINLRLMILLCIFFRCAMRSDQKQILEEGGFTVVTKSKRNRRSNKSVKKAQIPSEDPPEDSEVARSKLLRQAEF